MTSEKLAESVVVERVLERFKNDLWIQRRLALDEVVEFLKHELKDQAQSHASSSIRAGLFEDYAKFLDFLKDQCTGQNLTSDKQWGHLLNLMSVSRKVNHRSAKFSDILQSKDRIEANFHDIRKFNESIKRASTIDEALADLDRNLESCELIVGSSRQSDEASQHSQAEVAKAIRRVENTSGLLISNLSVELYSKSIDPLFGRERQTWLDSFSRLEGIFNAFVQFLNRYHDFVRNLSELRPLLQTLDGRQTMRPANQMGPAHNGDTLQSLLASCHAEFGEVIHFEQRLTAFLGAQIKQKPAVARSAKQQVPALKLLKLLDARLRFKDEILTVGLDRANKSMIYCQNTLAHIKRSLRLEFGRFYFLNDLDLLTLISLDVRLVEECEQPVQGRLIRKIFNNSIHGFSLSASKDGTVQCVTGVSSSIGEQIHLEEADWVPLKKRVNIYSLEVVRILNELLRKLRRSLSAMLRNSIKKCSAHGGCDLRSAANDIDWSLPVQLFDLAERVKCTRRIESELAAACPNLQPLIEFYEAKLDGLRSMLHIGQSERSNKMLALKVSAAISISVHFIALLVDLKQSAVCSAGDWNWQKWPRFYSNSEADQLEVRIATATFTYRFDLLCIETTSELDGKSQRPNVSIKRLISTDTSVRCFVAASQAIAKLNSGANPFGPAGSGKTETIKALGHLLGCQVIVHNCDETNDSESLERLIWGLAHTGLWGCFDEFNRLSASTLSSVSSALELVQTSLRSGSLTIELEGGEMKSIDPDSAFFVTLNPAGTHGSKYGGRRPLPANLRSLFLPVAMYQVQIEAIVRQMLLVHGLRSSNSGQRVSNHRDAANSSDLAQRFSKWIQMARSELGGSQRNRCEFDLRLVLVVLKRLFHLLAASPQIDSDTTTQFCALMVSAIQTEVCPRLEEAQMQKFGQTLWDCFATNASMPQRDARRQLEAQLEGRSGVILLGESGSGKSTAWRSLLAKLNGDRPVICCSTLNPKAYEKTRLFGFVERLSGKWVDGIFTKLVRLLSSQLQNEPDLKQAWIVLDGEIDPDWIECLNSVLDDNQVLTLSSGERINFIVSAEKCIKLIIETDSIQYGSPATISRLGLVYHEKTAGSKRVPERDILDFYIVHGGRDSSSRLSEAMIAAGREQRSVTYSCGEYSNSHSLVELVQLSPSSPCTFIIQNLELIRAEDNWATRTFVELLRYMITYKRYYDKDLNEIELFAESRFIITANSLDAVGDQRLVAVAKTVEAGQEARELPQILYETVDAFVKDQLQEDSNGFGILVVQSEQARDIKRDVILEFESKASANVDVFQFNNKSAQTRSIEKLEKLLKSCTVARTNDHRKCVFLLDSLQLYLMDEASKRRLYDLANLLAIKKLSGAANKILVCLDQQAELEAKFWRSLGRSCAIASSSSSAFKLQESVERGFANLASGTRHAEWLSQQVASLAAAKESKVRDHFVSILVEMIAAMREGLRERTKMLRSGLDKLGEFEAQVEGFKCKKEEEDALLRGQRLKIEALMQQIDLELVKSGSKKDEIARVQREMEDKSATLETQTRAIESELEHVLPLIETSKREVGSCLRLEALNEIKALRAPPKTIKDILDVLFLFLDLKDTSWPSIKAHLTRLSLRDELMNYDFERRLDGARLARIKREIDSRRDSFQVQQAKRASEAILPIFNWIYAALEYGRVSVKLRPLTEARHRLECEARQLADARVRLEGDMSELEGKVAADRSLLDECQAEYANAMLAATRMEAELCGARKIIANSAKQVSSWRERLHKLEFVAANERSLDQICLVCAATAAWAHKLDEVSKLLNRFGHKLAPDEQLGTLLTLARDHVNMLLDSCGEEHIETSTLKPDELASFLQLVRLKLCLRFKSKSRARLPFVQFAGSKSKVDGNLSSALSARNIVCAPDELVIVRPGSGPAGSWRPSFDLGLKMDKLLAVQLDEPDLDTVEAVLEHSHDGRIILFGADLIRREAEATSPLSELLHVFTIDQRADCEEASLADQIGRLVARNRDPKVDSEIGELESSLVLKQREQRDLEASLLKKLNQSIASDDIDSLAPTGLKSDLIRTLNQLEEAAESLGANIVEIKEKLASVHLRQAEHVEVFRRVAKFYASFLWRAQGSDDFYAFPVATLVELLLASTPRAQSEAPQSLPLGMRQLGAILTRAMCPMRPQCRAEFTDRLVASAGELAALLDDATDAGDVAKLAQDSHKSSADLCHNLIDLLLTGDRRADASTSGPASARHRARNFELVVVLHDEKRPSPQAAVDELFGRSASALIGADNEFHYQKVYARSQRQAAGSEARAAAASNHGQEEPLGAHLRRLVMSPPGSAGSAPGNQAARTQARVQTRVVCVANAHLAAGWINAQLLELLEETRGSVDERLVLLLIGESSERRREASSRDEPSAKLALNLLEAAALKFWYDELALNALDRYKLYLGPLRHAYAPTGRAHKTVSTSRELADDAEKVCERRAATGELIEELVMFHVVCQELIRLRRSSAGCQLAGLALWQKADYNFDYEQLSLALKIWTQIGQTKGQTSLEKRAKRELFGHLLESIVYGSRLETGEDGELLKFLLARFMQTQPAARSETVKRKRLLALERLAASDLSAPADGISSARYANELARLIGVLE